MPARPMWRSPHKKQNPWGRGYQPEVGLYKVRGDDKGGVPKGKKKKSDRVKTGAPGSGNGKHDDRNPKDCRCGRCSTIG